VIIRFGSILTTSFASNSTASQSGKKVLLQHPVKGFLTPYLGKSSGKDRGYTLIELAVVLVVLGIIFSFTMPKFRQALLSDSLDATSMRLIGLVQDLREKAIGGHVSYTLHFDIQEKRIWSVVSDASEEDQEAARERAYELPDDVMIQDIWSWRSGTSFNEAAVLVSRKGYVEQSMIHLESEDGREISLELTPFLGSIKIHEGYVDISRG
jgi:general secretion pathway protein H